MLHEAGVRWHSISSRLTPGPRGLDPAVERPGWLTGTLSHSPSVLAFLSPSTVPVETQEPQEEHTAAPTKAPKWQNGVSEVLLCYFKSKCPRSLHHDIYALPQAFIQLTVWKTAIPSSSCSWALSSDNCSVTIAKNSDFILSAIPMQVLWAMSKPCLAPMDKGVGREGEGEGARWGTGGGIRRVWDQKSVVTTSCLLHQENRFSRAVSWKIPCFKRIYWTRFLVEFSTRSRALRQAEQSSSNCPCADSAWSPSLQTFRQFLAPLQLNPGTRRWHYIRHQSLLQLHSWSSLEFLMLRLRCHSQHYKLWTKNAHFSLKMPKIQLLQFTTNIFQEHILLFAE